MNQSTSAPGASLLPSGTGAITTIHFAILGILAVLVILGILWGIRLKRTRVQAQRDVVVHAEEAGVVAAPVEDEAPTPAPVPEPAPLADEPIAAAAPMEASPATLAADAPVGGPRPADGSITQLKGLGPKVATRLGELGITSVGQLAALSDDDAETLDAQLGAFSGRMARDRWVEQARFLAAGDTAGFEAVFGKL